MLFLLFSTFIALAVAALQSSSITSRSPVISRDISLNAAVRMYSVKRPIDGSWQSLSIEFSYIADYFGNLTYVQLHPLNILPPNIM